jgi:hypothetical protein
MFLVKDMMKNLMQIPRDFTQIFVFLHRPLFFIPHVVD